MSKEIATPLGDWAERIAAEIISAYWLDPNLGESWLTNAIADALRAERAATFAAAARKELTICFVVIVIGVLAVRAWG